jgi:Na+/melibiose symporter-like transporter
MGAALMHTGYYFGFLLAAAANYFIGSRFGCRSMFVVWVTPALLIALIRNRVHEPLRWQNRMRQLGERWTMHRSFSALFSRRYRRRTIFNSIYLSISLVGLWAGSVYVPAAITYLSVAAGRSTAEAAQLASYSTALFGIATVITAVAVPYVADWLGRRITLAILFAVIRIGFGHAFYMRSHAVPWFMVCAFFLGVGGANFIVYSFWLPEQYGTECRASAFALTTNLGRFAAAGFTFLVGAGVHHFQTLGKPVATTAFAYLIGIALLPFGAETQGNSLPD